MTRSMLIDAAHREETRIAVVNERRLEDFDYEAAARTTLKGNIYLGKIARVEASLQAAFVEYGGDRHGFLPFADIHPDYYRLPQEDRQALIEEEAAARRDRDLDGGYEVEEAEEAEGQANGRDEPEEDRRRANRLRRQYNIQEVIKRRQIVLVQVSKEERGTKGAALTTYISLAGRYCVLMPNTGHGGGISRKITNATDRRKLKTIVEGLDIPDGMAVIMRTAGVNRTKTEIKRDYDFLTRTWERIREDTLSSKAPTLIYEEADLVKRAIRDIYGRDVDQVLVEGDEAYRSAKDFMKALMPSHARRVRQYKDQSEPLFVAHGIEDQLYDLHTPRVELPSGGYLVIDSTEALVAIDVNSGRSTRERNIEETALKTNLEAADEVARQLRLRDLAGLIVIDFIDMDDRRNNSQVERRLKDALSTDRARVQVGRISAFGLLEMSRQRLRPSIHESSTVACSHCHGTGFVRSVESGALQIARAIEQEALNGGHGVLSVYLSTDTALYLLNHKRDLLNRLAQDHGVTTLLQRDDTQPPGSWRFEGLAPRPREEGARREPEDAGREPEAADAAAGETPEADDEDGGTKRRRRSRRGGRRRKGGASDEPAAVEATEAAEPVEAPGTSDADDAETAAPAEAPSKPKRRRRRIAAAAEPEPAAQEPDAPPAAGADAGDAAEDAPKPRRRRTRRKKDEAAAEPSAEVPAESAAEPAEAGPAADADAAEAPQEAPKPRRRRTRRTREEAPEAAAAEAQPQEAPAPAPEASAPEPEPELEAAAPEPEAPAPEPEPEAAAPEPEAPAPEPAAETAPAPDAEAEPAPRRGWWRQQLNLV